MSLALPCSERNMLIVLYPILIGFWCSQREFSNFPRRFVDFKLTSVSTSEVLQHIFPEAEPTKAVGMLRSQQIFCLNIFFQEKKRDMNSVAGSKFSKWESSASLTSTIEKETSSGLYSSHGILEIHCVRPGWSAEGGAKITARSETLWIPAGWICWFLQNMRSIEKSCAR